MFKKFLSTKINDTALNVGLLILRLASCLVMIPHGYKKYDQYDKFSEKFMDFMNLGKGLSLSLTIGAELICSLFLALGIFTRISLIPLIIAMLVAVFSAHNGEIFGDGEHGFLYLIIYLFLFLSGPGKLSLDHLFFKRSR